MKPSRRSHLLYPVLAVASLGLAVLAACSRQSPAPTAPAESRAVAVVPASDMMRADRAAGTLADRLLALPGVTGVGVGVADGRAVVMVFADREDMPVPATVSGVSVHTEVTGEFQPFALTGTYRPVAIGVSGGNANECLPGTIGAVLRIHNQPYLLSANHVFARQNRAAIGEAIVQPSLPDLDPGCGPPPAGAVVGVLADFEPVVYDGKTPNRMDAAIASMNGQPSCATPAGFYGFPGATLAPPQLDLAVMKVGRTTELTRARIKAIDVKVKITFPSGTALFTGQIVTTAGFGGFGDSGSLVVADDGTRRPVGMLIGGGNTGTGIVTPIGVILDRFGATICSN